jgi:hypothetical protein
VKGRFDPPPAPFRYVILDALLAALEEKASAFLAEKGYKAPYWELFEMARQALEESRASLAPAL